MRKLHKWRKHPDGRIAHLVCKCCGATRWGISGGWGRAMKDGRPERWCKA